MNVIKLQEPLEKHNNYSDLIFLLYAIKFLLSGCKKSLGLFNVPLYQRMKALLMNRLDRFAGKWCTIHPSRMTDVPGVLVSHPSCMIVAPAVLVQYPARLGPQRECRSPAVNHCSCRMMCMTARRKLGIGRGTYLSLFT